MEGKLDFETTQPLREDLGKLIRDIGGRQTDSVAKKIVFDLERLEFVGSSGISSFVQTLKDFNITSPNRPLYTNVGSEFKRVIQAFDDAQNFQFEENQKPFAKKQIEQ